MKGLDMLLDAQESQLVLVDYQARLMPAIHEHVDVILNGTRLARLARLMDIPLWGVEQNPSGLGAIVAQIRDEILAGDGKILSKMHFSAVEEGLGEWLRPPVKAPQGNARSLPKHLQKPAGNTRNAVVIAGCEAHVCLMQTALDLLEDEFEVWVVTDACGSRTERNRDAAFDRLAGAGAELVTTEMVAFEWLRTAEHPAFKAVLDLVK
jgi:nicotinamidase-related amidase